MFAFAFVADSAESEPVGSCIERMLDAWPHESASSRLTESVSHAAAGLLRWPVCGRDAGAAPIRDLDRGLLVNGDVRLYDRSELQRQIGTQLPETAPDLLLAYHAYLRWGSAMACHLNGDFAFVAWNERSRSLFAVRDHFGLRPMFFRVEGSRILLASDVTQIVRVAKYPLRVDTDTVSELLLRTARRHGRSYFDDVHSIRPGHQLRFYGGQARTDRYWSPPVEQRSVAYRDECAEVRSLFIDAVRSRLETERPIVAHSSGGFDSSTIVMVADQEYERTGCRPPLVLASALTPGMPCDDSHYMDAISRKVRFSTHSWNALEGGPIDEITGFSLGSPDPGLGLGGGPPEDLRLARQLGAGVLLTGLFGDTLLFASGLTRDLVRNRRWRKLLAVTSRGSSAGRILRILGKASLGVLPPGLALGALHRWNWRSAPPPPSWMGPRLLERYPWPPPELEIDASAASHMAAETWARLVGPVAAASVFTTVSAGIRAGIEVRAPYLDIKLVERVLRIPWSHRLSLDDPRRLGSDALGDLLPPEFASRRDQGTWVPVFEHNARKILPAVRRLVQQGRWVAAPFLEKAIIINMLERAERGATDSVRFLLRVGLLEAWLRDVCRQVECDV